MGWFGRGMGAVFGLLLARVACCHAVKLAGASSIAPAAKDARRSKPKPKPPPVGKAPDSKSKSVNSYAAMKACESLVPYTYELPSTTPPPGYVDVAVTHCGICHSDVHQIDDAWKVACFPLVPGHEIVGTIAAVGEDDETQSKFKLGDRAAIGVQRGCCGCCAACDEGLENVCPKILKTYAGPGKDKGGFASLIRYPAAWTFHAPAGLPSELIVSATRAKQQQLQQQHPRLTPLTPLTPTRRPLYPAHATITFSPHKTRLALFGRAR